MSEDINNYQHTNFNLYQAYSYTLLLKIEAPTFSYAVVFQNRLLLMEQNCDLQDLVQPGLSHDILSAVYNKTIIGLPATGLTLVPKSLFDPERVNTFARFLDVKPEEKVLAQPLDRDNYIVYKADERPIAMAATYGLENTVFGARGWIKAVAKNDHTGKIHMEIGKETVHFCYYTNNKLRFFNSFEFKNTDELVYFTSFVADELGLKPQYLTLVVSGDIMPGDKNASRLADFFRNVEFNTQQVVELPAELTAHKLLALTALSLCGSSEAR